MKTMKTSVRIAGVLAEIQAEHIPNASLEHHHYPNVCVLLQCCSTKHQGLDNLSFNYPDNQKHYFKQ
jgi:hypothetical protein